MTGPVWLHWVGIAALVAGSTAFVARIDPSPGTNLALGASVTTSSNDGTLASSKGAVDGDIWKVGFRTDLEDKPWVLLDLGREKVVSRFVVYNCYDRYPYPAARPAVEYGLDAQQARGRFDCRQENEIPLAVQLSHDGREFFEVARRDRCFELWVQPIAPQWARYVRVQLLRKQRLQLREVEVY